MKKSLKKTCAIALVAATSMGVVGTSDLVKSSTIDAGNTSYVKADGEFTAKNYLSITNYDKTVGLYNEFALPEVKFFDGTNASGEAVSEFTVTTPSGFTFDQTSSLISNGKFVVDEIGEYFVSYVKGNYAGEISFNVTSEDVTIDFVQDSETLIPSKIAIKDKNDNAFAGEFNVPNVVVKNESGDVVDAIVEISLTTPSYEISDISSTKKVVFNADNKIEEGYYIITYTAYSKNGSGEKDKYLNQTTIQFEGVSEKGYSNEYELSVEFDDEKPQSVNVGKTIVLPGVVATNKDTKETVNVTYSVVGYKNGSSTAITDADKFKDVAVLVEEDGKWEFTADEVGVYYSFIYTIKDAFGNQTTKSFNINTVQDNLTPTVMVVDAYATTGAGEETVVDNEDNIKDVVYKLKSIVGNEPVYIKAIYASDLATVNYSDFKFERILENANRTEIYKNTNFSDAKKELVFNHANPESLDADKYLAVDQTLNNGTYYITYKVTDAYGKSSSQTYKFVIDNTFDWKDANGEYIKPVVSFNDKFYSAVELGEVITFNEITASCEKDQYLFTRVYGEYYKGTELLSTTDNLVLKDGKYSIDTSKAPEGATMLKIHAEAVNDNDNAEQNTGKATPVEIKLYSEKLEGSAPVITNANYASTTTYTQGDTIEIPSVELTGGKGGVSSLSTVVSVKCTLADKSTVSYEAKNGGAVRIGDTYLYSGAKFMAATAGSYQVSVKVSDGAGNVVVQFFNYTVESADFAEELRFGNIGISEDTMELGETYKLPTPSIEGAEPGTNYDYYVTCVEGPTDATDYKYEFIPTKVGEYKLQYVMYDADTLATVSAKPVELTITVKDTTDPKINLVWETNYVLANGATTADTNKQAIKPAYDVNTTILLPKFSISDNSKASGIDKNKSNVVISSSKTGSYEIAYSDINNQFSTSGKLAYKFTQNAEYTITYNAYDIAGNHSKVVKTIKIGDLVAPTLIIDDAIVNQEFKKGQTITIDLSETESFITVEDNKTDLKKNDIKVSLWVGNVKQTETKDGDKVSFTLKDAGEYELRFEVTDGANLKTTKSKYFTIEEESGSSITQSDVTKTLLIVGSVLVLGGVVVYFIISKKKLDKLYK